MMSKMRKGILVLIAVVVLIMFVSIVPVAVSELVDPAEPQVEETIPEYMVMHDVRGVTDGGLRTGFFYSDSMLNEDPNHLYPELAKASVVLAAAGYDKGLVNNMLDQMGYTHCNELFTPRTLQDNDHVAFTVGWKYNEELNKCYWCIVVRGTCENAEWFSNFNLGKNNGGYHKGFYLAANEAMAILNSYVDRYGAGYTNVFWFTGHSRGAAVANIMAGKYTEDEKIVFGYTFACPAVSRHADTSMQNIHNYNNSGDPIAIVPLREWHDINPYDRFGQSYSISFSEMPTFGTSYYNQVADEYHATSDTMAFSTILRTIVPNEETYYDDARQMGIMALAFALGGYNDADFWDVVITYGKGLAKYVQNKIDRTVHKVLEIIDVFHLFTEDESEPETIAKFLTQAIIDTKDFDEEQFAQYLEDHYLEFNDVYDLTDKYITCKEDLPEGLENIMGLDNSIADAAIVIACIIDVARDSGNLADAIKHGHHHTPYVLAINKMYYGYEGYKGITDLTIIDMREDIRTIGVGCFSGCQNLLRIELSDSIEIIGEGCFLGCSSLHEIDIHKNIKVLGKRAFARSGLTSLIIPDTLREIGDECFGSLASLKVLTVPVEYLMQNRLYVYETSGSYEYTNNLTTLNITKGKTGIMGDLTSRESEENPNHYQKSLTYQCRTTLENVFIEKGVENIGDYAFSNGNPENTFTINIPSTVVRIGVCAFMSHTKLADQIVLPEGLTELGEYCFLCSDITNINIPSSLTELPASGFARCTGLTSLVIPDTVEEIGDQCFGGLTGLRELTIPVEYLMQNRLYVYETSGSYVYTNHLTTLNITKGKTGIMGDLTNRESEENPNHYQNSLTYLCRATLEKVVIEEGVENIGAYAFSYGNLANAFEINIPSTVVRIGVCAFMSHTKLADQIVLPEGLTELGVNCFEASDITSINIPSSLAVLPKSGFAHCIGLTSLLIPDTVEEIGDQCFGGLTGLRELTIPVEYLMQNRLYVYETRNSYVYTNNLINLYISKGKTGIMGDLTSRETEENPNHYQYSLTYLCRATLGKVVIEEGVRNIGAYAFSYGNPTNTFEINIPSTVARIGVCAFMSHTKLADQIVLPEGLTELGEYSFSFSDITSINIPSTLTVLPASGFARCTGLTSLVIPDTVEEIGNSCLGGMSGLKELTIPVEYLMQNRLYVYETSSSYVYTNNLTKLNISKGRTGIMGDLTSRETEENPNHYQYSLTYLCRATLEKVVIEEGVRNIGIYAFWYGSNTSLNMLIPYTLKNIGAYAFSSSKLASVDYNSTEMDWNQISIASGNAPLIAATKHFAQLAFVNLALSQYAPVLDGVEEAEMIDRLAGGSRVALLDEAGEWSKVRTGKGKVGYVDSQQITTGFPYATAEDFVLPNQLTVISEEAFAGLPLKAVIIPDNCSSIESKAFDGTGLALVYLPAGVHSISDDAFPGTTIIFTPENSDAAGWAAQNNRPLVIIGEAPVSE